VAALNVISLGVACSNEITSVVRAEAERAAAMRSAERALGTQLKLNRELLQQLKDSGAPLRASSFGEGSGGGSFGGGRGSSGEARAVESLLRDRLGHFKLDKVLASFAVF